MPKKENKMKAFGINTKMDLRFKNPEEDFYRIPVEVEIDGNLYIGDMPTYTISFPKSNFSETPEHGDLMKTEDGFLLCESFSAKRVIWQPISNVLKVG